MMLSTNLLFERRAATRLWRWVLTNQRSGKSILATIHWLKVGLTMPTDLVALHTTHFTCWP
jgi:hypothetical protein